jgi:hypothetical protein
VSNLYVCIDIDPSTNRILGTRAQGDIIETDKPVLLSDAIFGDDGVMGHVVDEKVKFKRPLTPVKYNADGEILNEKEELLLTAAYALVSPRSGVKYTNERP